MLELPSERIRTIRPDGATLLALYLTTLLVLPARLVVARVPLTLPPALGVALALGVLLVVTHCTTTLGLAKGSNAVRTMLVLYLSSHLLTYALATRRGLPFDELRVADSSLIRIVGALAVAWFVCDAVVARLDTVLRGLVYAVAFCAAIGLVQFALGVDLAAFINLPGLRTETAYSAVEARSSLRRPTGTTNHPIEYGLVCAVAVPIAVHHLLQAFDRGAPRGRWILCLGLTAAGALTSLSRTAVIGLVLAIVVLLLAMPDPRKYLVAVLGGVTALGASAVVPGLLGTLYGMFAFLDSDPSVSGRTDDYPRVWMEVALHPWLGRGFGTYLPTRYQILDNQYLLTIIENGWVGLVTFSGLILIGGYAVLRVRRRSTDPDARRLAACLLASLAVIAVGAGTFDLLAFGVATGVMSVVVGASGALLRTLRRPPHRANLRPRPVTVDRRQER